MIKIHRINKKKKKYLEHTQTQITDLQNSPTCSEGLNLQKQKGFSFFTFLDLANKKQNAVLCMNNAKKNAFLCTVFLQTSLDNAVSQTVIISMFIPQLLSVTVSSRRDPLARQIRVLLPNFTLAKRTTSIDLEPLVNALSVEEMRTGKLSQLLVIRIFRQANATDLANKQTIVNYSRDLIARVICCM